MKKRVSVFLCACVLVYKSLLCMAAPPPPTSITPDASGVSQSLVPVVTTDLPVEADLSDVASAEMEAEQSEAKMEVSVDPSGQALAESDQGGPETVDLSEEQIGLQGNWVKKKRWLKEAYAINDKVQDMVVSIQKSRKGFYDQFIQIDQELDNFYKNEGLQEGKTAAVFQGVEDYIEEKRMQRIQKTQQEGSGVTGEYEVTLEEIDDDIANLKDQLEQLKLDIKSIGELDQSIKERLDMVDKQINIALELSKKSRDMTNQIWYIIDDKKAGTVFYNLKGQVYQQVKSIQDYVQSVLSNDFSQVLNTTRQRMNAAKTGIQDLEKKGMIIKDRAERIKEIKLSQLDVATETEEIKPVEPAELPEPSWYEKIYNYFVDMFATVYNWGRDIVNWFISVFGAQQEPEKKVDPNQMPTAVATELKDSPDKQID